LLSCAAAGATGDGAALGRGLRGVQHQVHEDLVDLLRLALDAGSVA
jgi:hypothetical protein